MFFTQLKKLTWRQTTIPHLRIFFIINKRSIIPKGQRKRDNPEKLATPQGQSKIDNPEKLATQGTQDTG